MVSRDVADIETNIIFGLSIAYLEKDSPLRIHLKFSSLKSWYKNNSFSMKDGQSPNKVKTS